MRHSYREFFKKMESDFESRKRTIDDTASSVVPISTDSVTQLHEGNDHAKQSKTTEHSSVHSHRQPVHPSAAAASAVHHLEGFTPHQQQLILQKFPPPPPPPSTLAASAHASYYTSYYNILLTTLPQGGLHSPALPMTHPLKPALSWPKKGNVAHPIHIEIPAAVSQQAAMAIQAHGTIPGAFSSSASVSIAPAAPAASPSSAHPQNSATSAKKEVKKGAKKPKKKKDEEEEEDVEEEEEDLQQLEAE